MATAGAIEVVAGVSEGVGGIAGATVSLTGGDPICPDATLAVAAPAAGGAVWDSLVGVVLLPANPNAAEAGAVTAGSGSPAPGCCCCWVAIADARVSGTWLLSFPVLFLTASAVMEFAALSIGGVGGFTAATAGLASANAAGALSVITAVATGAGCAIGTSGDATLSAAAGGLVPAVIRYNVKIRLGIPTTAITNKSKRKPRLFGISSLAFASPRLNLMRKSSIRVARDFESAWIIPLNRSVGWLSVRILPRYF